MKNFDVNTDDLIGYTSKLNKLHRSAFPVAVKQTLNDAAFDARNNITDQAKKSGQTIRTKKSIYDVLSRVIKADGWDVNSMSSEVGIFPKGDLSVIAHGLAKQETGGTLPNTRIHIPLKDARTGNNTQKQVRRGLRISKVNYRPKRVKKGDHRRMFIEARRALKSPKEERFIDYGGVIWKIDRVIRKNNDSWIKGKPVYSREPGKRVKLKKSPFLKPSVKIGQSGMAANYVKYAKKRFAKYQ